MSKLKKNLQLTHKISGLIQSAKSEVARTINTTMLRLYWQIGKTIQEELIKNDRAEYGKRIVTTVSSELTLMYGKGYSRSNLTRMVEFYKSFPDVEIGATASHQLSWSHIVEILKLKDPLRKEFYITLCTNEAWSVRELVGRIDSMLFERTTLSQKGEKTIYNDLKKLREEKEMSIELFLKDPYMLDFLGLKQVYNEQDLESSILLELQQFILEFGNDFAFLARQKRITIDQEDFYIDLLFYHRKLNRLVAIELKLGKFKADYKGQSELYLRWLDKYEKKEGENPPIGLLLCSEKSNKMIELLELDKSGIHVATYLTDLLPIEQFKQKLLQSVVVAQKQLNTKDNGKQN